MLYNRRIDRILLLIVPAALFVYASTRPHVRLRVKMQPQFVDVRPSASREERAAEERLAQEYWQLVLSDIQWKHTYGSPLPDLPPEEFRVSNPTLNPGQASSSRLRYWRRLQKIWALPSSWETSQEWSTDWLTEPINKALVWLRNYVKDLFAKT